MPNIRKNMKLTFILLLIPIISFSETFSDSLVKVMFHPNWTGWSELEVEKNGELFYLNFTITTKNNYSETQFSEKSRINIKNVTLIKEFFKNYTFTQDSSMLIYSSNENGDTVITLKDRTDNKKRLYVFGEYYEEKGMKRFNFRKTLTNEMDIKLIELLVKICHESLTENGIIDYMNEMEIELKE